MKFSEYVILGRQGMMMDPLGFLSPYTALQDKLFKQFTVLSNHPAYHGVLALVYQTLADGNITPKQKDFSLQFRRAEILWGVLHAVGPAPSSVLNITKYTALIRDRSRFALSDIHKNDRIYASLNYGTLGHYSSPSTSWGILGKSGQQLTDRGSELAMAFGNRKGKSLRAALDSWRKGDSWNLAKLQEFARLFDTAAEPDPTEAGVWRKLIDEYCERTPRVLSLWKRPLTIDEEQNWQSSPAQYSLGYEDLRARYAPLKSELTQIELFERLIGIVQHIFEREYLACAEKGNRPLPFTALEDNLAAALRETAIAYNQTADCSDSKGLFASLQDAGDYQEAAQRICAHHVAHQKSKGSVPFMEDGEIRVRDKFDMRSYGERRSALESTGDRRALVAVIAFQHRRDWHFQRAGRYHRYAQAA